MPLTRVRSNCRLLLVAWGALILASQSQAQLRLDVRTSKLIEQLDHDQFQTRDAAARELKRRGLGDAEAQSELVSNALRHALTHDSMEVRAASRRLLNEMQLARRDGQLERLMNPRCPADTIAIAGWSMFCRIAGDDMHARRLFSRLSQRHPDALNRLDRNEHPEGQPPLCGLDPWRMSADDTAGWALLLLSESGRCKDRNRTFNSRLGTALSCSPMGPSVNGRADARVLQRLIDHWLRIPAERHAQRDRLLIAMRYGCHAAAAELCGQVLNDRTAAPSTEVTALLAAGALHRSDLELQAMARLHDSRTAHVWQLIASRRVKIRTQVRDVALAVLLHHRGIDPRQAGYRDLQADPSLIYRDHSLGFPDTSARREAQATSVNLLASAGGLDLAATFGNSNAVPNSRE